MTRTCEFSEEIKNTNFGDEIIADQVRLSVFKAQMQAYSQINYLPIVAFPATKAKEGLINVSRQNTRRR